MTVSYATIDGTATAGKDYGPVSGALTFAPESSAAQRIEIHLSNDRLVEDDETFLLQLTDPRGATLAVPTATATIIDNDTRAVAVDPLHLIVPEGASEAYHVALRSQPTAHVTVTLATGSAELSATPDRLVFSTATWAATQTFTVSAARDSDAVADPPVEVTLSASGVGYHRAHAPALQVTIVEVDVATVAVAAAGASEQARTLAFVVTLSLPSGQPITVDYATADNTATAGQDYRPVSGTLTFPPESAAAQTIAVTLLDDALDEPEEHLTLTLSNSTAPIAGGQATLTVPGSIEDDDEPPLLTIEDATSLSEGAGDGRMRFTVRLDPLTTRTVTVDYASADDTAAAGTDYTAVRGTLTFPAGAAALAIAVPILDDSADEQEMETFTVALSNAVNATLSAATRAARGTIHDDDLPPRVSIEDAALSEGAGDGSMRFTVRLDPLTTRTVTVDYASADDTAAAGTDYTAVRGTLTFPAGAAALAIAVPILDDSADEQEMETFTVALSGPRGATLSVATATGTITDNDELLPRELASLQVTGSGTMYPAFDPGTLHYALTCTAYAILTVNAQARSSATRLQLLRARPADNHVSTNGTLDVQVAVYHDHDIAIELSDTGGTTTYVVHCLPEQFPDISILTKTDQVAEGLLFLTPFYNRVFYAAIVDNNGVPRFHSRRNSDGVTSFRMHHNGPTVSGKQVRYSLNEPTFISLFASDFTPISQAIEIQPVYHTDRHDFETTEDSLMYLSVYQARRDLSEFGVDADGNPYPSNALVLDGVIHEVTPQGAVIFWWNSWFYRRSMQMGTDCVTPGSPHLNSIFPIDGDIVASFLKCSQILRIDKSTGALEWKLGGSAPPSDSATEHLEIVGDPAGEFCGQHQPTVTPEGKILIFDNGRFCVGPRKNEPWFTRVVEYDISSATQAVFSREYERPAEQGYSVGLGGVTTVENGNWLISWGSTQGQSSDAGPIVVVSEVDPDTGIEHFQMHMSKDTKLAHSYRVYRESEADVNIPLNLP